MTYYIITFTKVHHQITQEQRDKIMTMNFSEMEINGQLVKLSNIADILDEQKYFEAFPDKRPKEIRNLFEDIYGSDGNEQIRQPLKEVNRQMRQGFIDYWVDERRLSVEQAEAKLNEFKVCRNIL